MKSSKYLLVFGLLLTPLIAFSQGGPARDEFGETLARYNAPRAAVGGLAWDEPAHLIWGTNRAAPCYLWALNPDNGQIIHDYQIDQQGAANGNGDDAIGLGFDLETGLLWVNQWNVVGSSSVANLYDRDGRNVRRVQLPRGGHWDFDFDENWLYGYSEGSDGDLNDDRIYRMNRQAENVTIGPNLGAIAGHRRAVSLAFVPQHTEGHFWLLSHSYISQFDVNFEDNEADLIREFASNNNDYPHQGLTHDGFDLWGGGNWNSVNIYRYDDGIPEVYGEIGFERDEVQFNHTVRGESDQQNFRIMNLSDVHDEIHRLHYEISDVGDEPSWLRIDPNEGFIEAGEAEDVRLSAVTDDLEIGEYQREILIEANDPYQLETVIPIHILIVSGRGRISGQIRDAADGSGVEGAVVASVMYDYSDTTDENGYYSFDGIAAWNYIFEVSRRDYFSQTREIEVNPGDDLEENFNLLHGEFSLRPRDLEVDMKLNDTLQSTLTVTNPGNGTLTWSSTLDFPEEHQHAPWEVMNTLPISQITGDERIQAVVFVDGHYYLAGYANQEKLIYVLNSEGELLRTFPQLSQERFGFTSLTWDGELLWGGSDEILYGFNTDGDSITSFVGPVAQGSSNIVWDSQRQLYWVSGAITPIYGCDREGNIRTTLNARRMRTYGLGFHPKDPDGHQLYFYTNPIDSRRVVMKMDINTNDTMLAMELPDDGGRPAGCTISHSVNPYNWTFLGISNAGVNDRLYLHNLAAKTDWIVSHPVAGEIEPDATTEIDVSFDSNWLTPDYVYTTTLRFSHNGVGSMVELPVTLSVTFEDAMVDRTILLDNGWNLISTNVLPVQADDFSAILQPLVDAGQLILGKDGMGNFYWPDHNFDGIDSWEWQDGYWLKVSGEFSLTIAGQPLPNDAPIGLNRGWNTIAYVPRSPVFAEVGFSGLGDNLVIARDGKGRFYLPAYNFSDMDRLRPGAGYQVRVNEDAELVYSRDQRASVGNRYNNADAVWLDGISSSSAMHSLLVISDLKAGTRLEALTPSRSVAGRGVVGGDGMAGLTLYGDDPSTELVEGFVASEVPEIRVVSQKKSAEVGYSVSLSGDFAFTTGGWGVVELNSGTLPVEFGINSTYPNPFNSTLSLTFSLAQAGRTTLAAYDLSGRQVALLTSGRYSSGTHQVVWNAEGLAAGVYMLRLESNGRTATTKVVLVK